MVAEKRLRKSTCSTAEKGKIEARSPRGIIRQNAIDFMRFEGATFFLFMKKQVADGAL